MLERLTEKWKDKNFNYWICLKACKEDCLNNHIPSCKCKPNNDAIIRLAEYEGTCMSPEEVQDLAQAKAEGRLVVLPCKVGDKVWFITSGRVDYGYVEWIETDEEGIWTVGVVNPPENPIGFEFNDFGKIIFLTSKEAEKALGEKEDMK